MILDISDIYQGEFLVNKFAYKFFSNENKLYPLGNIVSFIGGVDFTTNNKTFASEMAVNFCMELPNINKFTANCIHRLINTNIANILSAKHLSCPIELDGTKIIIKQSFESGGIIVPEGKLSFGGMNTIDETTMIYTGLNIEAGPKAPGATFSMKLSQTDTEAFMKDVNANFYAMLNDIFKTSRR